MDKVQSLLAHALELEREAARRYEERVMAIDSERRGHACYSAIARTRVDPEGKLPGAEFAAEEAEHVTELEKLIAQRAAEST